MKKTIIILLAIIGMYGNVSAQKPAIMASDKTGWHKIGETKVDFKKESDEIVVWFADRFDAIKFKVKDAPVEFTSMDVYFESGDVQNVMLNATIKAPGETRIIDLKGGERNLKKIVFVYKTLPNRKDEKAHIELWGLKTNTNTPKGKK